MSEWKHIGADWSSGSWVAVGYNNDGTPDVGVYDDIQHLWDEHGESANQIVVDIPIGLCESKNDEEHRCDKKDGQLSRRCDDLARKHLGSRSSSVFTTPCRMAAQMSVRGEEYTEVNSANKRHTGKGLMKQAANISTGIMQVEDLILHDDGDKTKIVEGHPELCFRAICGEPLSFSKKTATGALERLKLLEDTPDYNTGDWRTLADKLRGEPNQVEIDDLLDAIVLAITAKAPEGEKHKLPENPHPDKRELPMQMVYRAKKPLRKEL